MADDAPLTPAELDQFLATAQPGSPEYVAARQLRDGMSAPPSTPPTAQITVGGAPQPPTASSELGVKPWGPPEIDYNAPIADVRKNLTALPQGPDRAAGWDKWADIQEQQATNQGGVGGVLRTANDLARIVAQGTPIGKWGDRINAGVNSLLPEVLGGRPYEEGLALEQARNRRSEAQHPIATPVGNLAGAAGTVIAAPWTALSGAGPGALAGNVGIDTIISAIRAIGDSKDLTQTGDVVKAAERDAGITAPVSLAANTLARSLG